MRLGAIAGRSAARLATVVPASDQRPCSKWQRASQALA
jgi:hypothetical protein